jgi:chitodextrinase
MTWAASQTTVTSSNFSIPSTLSWSGQPDTWNASSPGANASLHVTVAAFGNDVGVCAAYVKALTYYGVKSGNTTYTALAKSLLDVMATFADTKGIAVPETRTDYSRFNDPVFVPSGWSGKMPNGDPIAPGATFLSIRSWYKNDPSFPKVQAYLNGGAAPSFTYHRFWAQADIAMAYAVYGELVAGGGSTGGDTTPPSAPTNLAVTGVTSSTVSLSWTASTDNVAVTGYNVYRNSALAGTTTTATTFTDTGLSASTAYNYSVVATDAAGNLSAASSTVTGTTSAGTVSTGTVKAQYKNLDSSPGDNQIKPGLQVVNTGTTPLALSTVTMRYWFTSDGGANTFSTNVDYAVIGSGNVTHSVVAMPAAKTGADHYLLVGFTAGAGSLAAGASTGEIQNRFNKTDWSNFTETNDYSYATNTSYADAPKVTVYINGTLAYGTEPS